MLTIMRRLEAIDLSRRAALLKLPQPGRSCQPDIAIAVSTTIDPLAGTEGSNPPLSSGESRANLKATSTFALSSQYRSPATSSESPSRGGRFRRIDAMVVAPTNPTGCVGATRPALWDGTAHPQPVDIRSAASRDNYAFGVWAPDAAGTRAGGQCVLQHRNGTPSKFELTL